MVQTRATTKRIAAGDLPQIIPVSPKKRTTDDRERTLRKRPRGKPGELCQLNLDVLFLIAAYVHPLDLLNLARTCKSLRELLMDKSSTFVWKTARRQVEDLPDCPADLTEPEYANLVFYARCYGCGKHAKKILWNLRRRYCPECRQTRLCTLMSCPDIVHQRYVLPSEVLTIEGTRSTWIDKEQLDTFMHEYRHSSDKDQLLTDRFDHYSAVVNHASTCRYWEMDMALQRRHDLDSRRQQRSDNIFERLRQHGYQSEIAYFGRHEIKQAHLPHFRTSKPLTDREWAQLWPEWFETMNSFRLQKLERVVYKPRRFLLENEYANYVASSTNAPSFDLLPHKTDLACLPPFQDVITAPEGIEVDAKSFESAFEQLPALVEEWKTQIVAELVELVKIPSRYPARGTFKLAKTPTGIDKLHLACAIFHTGSYTATHFPEVFSTLRHRNDKGHTKEGAQHTTSILGRFNIKFVEEAAYIIHACGLDPSVATVEDMDRRNARLRCLTCRSPYVRPWRASLVHADSCLRPLGSQPHILPRWEVLGEGHLQAIQAAEASIDNNTFVPVARCLMCRHVVGDALSQGEVIHHISNRHGVDVDAVRLGEHYVSAHMNDKRWVVEVVAEGEEVTFARV